VIFEILHLLQLQCAKFYSASVSSASIHITGFFVSKDFCQDFDEKGILDIESKCVVIIAG
jgi:hypothetical protein